MLRSPRRRRTARPSQSRSIRRPRPRSRGRTRSRRLWRTRPATAIGEAPPSAGDRTLGYVAAQVGAVELGQPGMSSAIASRNVSRRERLAARQRRRRRFSAFVGRSRSRRHRSIGSRWIEREDGPSRRRCRRCAEGAPSPGASGRHRPFEVTKPVAARQPAAREPALDRDTSRFAGVRALGRSFERERARAAGRTCRA